MFKNGLKTVRPVVYAVVRLPQIPHEISGMICTTFTGFIPTKLQKKRVQEPKL